MRRVRRAIQGRSRRNKVGVGLGGIRRGEDLNVRTGRVSAAVDKAAVVHQKVYVRHWMKQEPSRA